jgi:hypothetical protein
VNLKRNFKKYRSGTRDPQKIKASGQKSHACVPLKDTCSPSFCLYNCFCSCNQYVMYMRWTEVQCWEPQLLCRSLYINSDFCHPDFLCGILQETKELIFACNKEPIRARQHATYCTYPAWGGRVPCFMAHSPLKDLLGPAALQGITPVLLWHVCLYSAGLLFSAWRWFFFGKIILHASCCCRLKSTLAYIFTLQLKVCWRNRT